LFDRQHATVAMVTFLDHNLTPSLFTILNTRSVKLCSDRFVSKCSVPLNNLATRSRYVTGQPSDHPSISPTVSWSKIDHFQ